MINPLPNNFEELCSLRVGDAVHKVNERPDWLYGNGWVPVPYSDSHWVPISLQLATKILNRVAECSNGHDYVRVLSIGTTYIVLCQATSGGSFIKTLER